MRVALSALLLSVAVLASPVMAGGDPSPDDLVARTLKAYTNLRTYSDTGVVLTTYQLENSKQAYHRQLQTHARFGDPDAQPTPYAYRVPFRAGKAHRLVEIPLLASIE